MTTTMERIESLADILATRMQALEGTLMAHQDELAQLHGKYRDRVTALSGMVAQAQADLKAEVWKGRALFEKPRTRKLAGLVVGLEKSKGRIEYEDEARVVTLIERHFPEMVEVLLIETKKPSKEALNNLPAGDLKRLGCTVTESTDQVVIRGVPTDMEKAARAIMESPAAKAAKSKDTRRAA